MLSLVIETEDKPLKLEPKVLTLYRLDHSAGKHNNYQRENCPLCGGHRFSREVEELLYDRSGFYGFE